MRARRGKDKAAPSERPRAKKKVIRAPAVSPSLGSTNLEGTGGLWSELTEQLLTDQLGSAATHCGAYDMDRQTK